MTLNQFGAELIRHLARLANAVEGIESKVGSAGRSTKQKEEPSKPKHDRAEVDKALIALKDAHGKDEAVAVYKGFGYAKMAEIAEKDFDAVYEKAVARLEELNSAGGEGEDL
ncbi:hypothetical protein CWI25_16735 [Pseudomonas aeruginosa]|uniref:hypothetical protein n=1 Tax=Pseudomonas aeruginosa TaxID=287 RepID=UPI000C2BEA26|nr:hypothetical protein [Pseudomonas aeruginosa]AUA71575.1 hypothetical protein CWI25_16735 [Pseudomonas aeruginosa]AUA96133.1 hypothetical protein CWI24_16895 [Pseudomonas aeruginosa]